MVLHPGGRLHLCASKEVRDVLPSIRDGRQHTSHVSLLERGVETSEELFILFESVLSCQHFQTIDKEITVCAQRDTDHPACLKNVHGLGYWPREPLSPWRAGIWDDVRSQRRSPRWADARAHRLHLSLL